MSIVFERSGFHFTPSVMRTNVGEPLFLIVKVKGRSTVEAPRLSVWEYDEDEYVSFINENNIKAVLAIIDDFSFLTRCHGIEMLNIIPSNEAPNRVAFDPVYQMPSLKMLQPRTIYGEENRKWSIFDCNELLSASRLEWFSANCKKGLKNLTALTGLKSLILSSYRANDLHEIIGSESLDTLSLLYCGINSLDGVKKSRALKVVKLDSCFRLTNIDSLYDSRETLQGLVITDCKNIRDYSVLSEFKNLTRLSIHGAGEIPSISFIDRLKKLRTLTLGINVIDGNLSYCDALEHASIFPNRRHYNRKDENLPKMPPSQVVVGDEGIDEWRRCVMS